MFGYIILHVTLIPMPLPRTVLQNSYFTHSFYNVVLQTYLGHGPGYECRSSTMLPPQLTARAYHGRIVHPAAGRSLLKGRWSSVRGISIFVVPPCPCRLGLRIATNSS